MKKITVEAVEALFDKRNFKKSNTEVEYILQPHSEISEMYLFGNLIARYNHRSNELYVSNCGWETNTTKERLNGILSRYNHARIFQKNFEWYIDTMYETVAFGTYREFDSDGYIIKEDEEVA